MTEQKPRWYSESLARGLAVIQAFGSEAPRLRIADVAKRTGLDRAAARRFLLTLQELGFIGSEGDLFFLRPRVLNLGFGYLSSVRIDQIVQPILKSVGEQTGASSALAVLDGAHILFVARVPSKGILSISPSIGGRVPAHSTSLGQVLLAGLPPAACEDYLRSSRREASTPQTLVDADALRARLDEVRRQGFALVESEHEEGIISLAVPVRDRTGRVAAATNINLYPVTPEKREKIMGYLPLLQGAASEIEEALRSHDLFQL